MLHFFRLLRPLNLLIIAFTMYMMRYFVLAKAYWQDADQNALPASDFDFFLLVFSTMLIAGGGYIINDYFDIKIDRRNKPEKVIVGRFIKKRVAMLWHTLLNIFAVGIGIYLSLEYHNPWPLVFHLTTTFLLWMYSLSLKRKFLSGNLVISLMAAMVVLLVGAFELPDMAEDPTIPGAYVHLAKWGLLFFAGMSFLSTLIREIIKDLADMEGDALVQCKTVPLVIGIPATKKFVIVLILALVGSIATVQIFLSPPLVKILLINISVTTPILIAAFACWKAHSRKDFLKSSNLMKFAMFTAVMYTFIDVFLP
jgi:4-hydroxybenzoate polyprenyltransferase